MKGIWRFCSRAGLLMFERDLDDGDEQVPRNGLCMSVFGVYIYTGFAKLRVHLLAAFL